MKEPENVAQKVLLTLLGREKETFPSGMVVAKSKVVRDGGGRSVHL